jgi:hypothetical protein
MRQAINQDQLYFGLVMHDPCLFAEHFFRDDLSLGLSKPQKMMFCDLAPRQLLCCGRKVAKTVKIESEIIRTGCTENGEGMFFTPQQAHITPVQSRVISRINRTPLFRALQTSFNKSDGIQDWRRGQWRWHWRIEGTSGSDVNMAGLRAKCQIGDELAWGNMPCYNSRELVALPGCRFIYAGVPNNWQHGVLYSLDCTKLGDRWSKHKLTTLMNPLFFGQERELIAQYKGKHTQEYQTQVLGQWGESVTRSFPPGAIAQKPTLPFFTATLGQHYIGQAFARPSENADLRAMLKIPRVNAQRYVLGVDYGYSPDPCVLLLCYEGEPNTWYELARIELVGVIPHHQAAMIHALNEVIEFKLSAIAIEYSGGGLAVAQELQRTDIVGAYADRCNYSDILVNANPGGVIDLPATPPSDLIQQTIHSMGLKTYTETPSEGPMVRLRRKQWMTETLRLAMICANYEMPGLKLWLAADDALIESIMNVSEERTATYVIYKKFDHNIGDHDADAARTVISAIDHANSRQRTEGDKLDVSAFGWVGQTDHEHTWRAPWH